MTFTRRYWPTTGAGWYGGASPEKGDIITGAAVSALGRTWLYHQNCFKQKHCKSCDIWDHHLDCEPVGCRYEADTLVHVLDVKNRDPAHVMVSVMINGEIRTILGRLKGRYSD